MPKTHIARLLLLGFLAVTHLSCGSSSSSSNTGNGGGGGSSVTVSFSGPKSAEPLSATKVLIAWLEATNSAGDPPSTMVYKVYRSTAIDLADEVLAGTTSPGVTSFVDTGLSDKGKKTYFYRVVARDLFGRESLTPSTVSAHPPAGVVSGGRSYTGDIRPLFFLEGENDFAVNEKFSCLHCHNNTAAQTDLRNWQGIMKGVGSISNPDSFVTPGDQAATRIAFLDRFKNFAGASDAHGPLGGGYQNMNVDITSMALVLANWAGEGALENPDSNRPIMNFAAVGNGTYEASYDLINNQVTINFFHADDPESEPPHTNYGDPLSYSIYAGETSNTIDWDNPLVETARYTFSPLTDISVTFNYSAGTGVFVIRPLDFFGNEALNEIEISVSR